MEQWSKVCSLLIPPSTCTFFSSMMHSFISTNFMYYLGFLSDWLGILLGVISHSVWVVVLDQVYRRCVVNLDTLEFRDDMVVLSIHYFDIILGMEWLLTL